MVRDRKGALDAGKKAASLTAPPPTPWKTAQTLDIVEGPGHLVNGKGTTHGATPIAVICSTLEEVRELASRAVELSPNVRAVLAPFIPSGQVTLFSGVGIAALRLDAAAAKALKGQRSIVLPAPSGWSETGPTQVAVGSQKVALTWLALGPERAWVGAGTSRAAPARSRG